MRVRSGRWGRSERGSFALPAEAAEPLIHSLESSDVMFQDFISGATLVHHGAADFIGDTSLQSMPLGLIGAVQYRHRPSEVGIVPRELSVALFGLLQLAGGSCLLIGVAEDSNNLGEEGGGIGEGKTVRPDVRLHSCVGVFL